jgi:hypothetical protein
VRRAFDASYEQMLRLIATAPADVFNQLHDWMDGNAASDYAEHSGWIGDWMAREHLPGRSRDA